MTENSARTSAPDFVIGGNPGGYSRPGAVGTMVWTERNEDGTATIYSPGGATIVTLDADELTRRNVAVPSQPV